MRVNLKEICKKQKISYSELAIELGVTQQTVQSWAVKRRQPRYNYIEKICKALKCGIEELLIIENF